MQLGPIKCVPFRLLLAHVDKCVQIRWEDVQPSLAKDGRYDLPGLTDGARRHLFQEYISTLRTKRTNNLEMIFDSNAPQLDTSFADVFPKIAEEADVKRIGSESRVAELYSTWQRKRKTQAYQDFNELLKENSFVDFWGRLKKEGNKNQHEVNGFGNADEDEQSQNDQIDVRTMSKQIDLTEIKAVLKVSLSV